MIENFSSCQVFLFVAQPADQLRHLASLLHRWTPFDLSKMRSIENDDYMNIRRIVKVVWFLISFSTYNTIKRFFVATCGFGGKILQDSWGNSWVINKRIFKFNLEGLKICLILMFNFNWLYLRCDSIGDPITYLLIFKYSTRRHCIFILQSKRSDVTIPVH